MVPAAYRRAALSPPQSSLGLKDGFDSVAVAGGPAPRVWLGRCARGPSAGTVAVGGGRPECLAAGLPSLESRFPLKIPSPCSL